MFRHPAGAFAPLRMTESFCGPWFWANEGLRDKGAGGANKKETRKGADRTKPGRLNA